MTTGRESGPREHRASDNLVRSDFPADAEPVGEVGVDGKADEQPFHLPEWTSEPHIDEEGHWWVTRMSGCLMWRERVEEPHPL